MQATRVQRADAHGFNPQWRGERVCRGHRLTCAACKVDDLAGHRLREIIVAPEGFIGCFSIEGAMGSVEVVEVFPFVEFGFEIDVTLESVSTSQEFRRRLFP